MIFREQIEWEGNLLTLETGRIARQADGAVLVSYGDSRILCTVVASRDANPDIDFFPFSVHYQEKSFAAGRIPGGFMKREGKPSEKEVLASRLIDRPLRPLFPEGFRNEVQVICTVLSYDPSCDTEVAAIIGASAALSIAGLPFQGPVGAVRLGYKDGEFRINPPKIDSDTGDQLDLMVAGTREGVLMVEAEAHELSEALMLEAITKGHQAFQPVIDLIDRLKEKASKPHFWSVPEMPSFWQALVQRMQDQVRPELQRAYRISDKRERRELIEGLKASLLTELEAEFPDGLWIQKAFEDLQYAVLREDILKNNHRVDGRTPIDIRPINCEVGFLPRTHGSALFTRGETQALVVTTLGTAADEQLMDQLAGEYREGFLLHYNFPPYSVGETGRMSSPGRREIGHGKLAWRAIHPLMPDESEFSYMVRAVSEITESNGSSSMATVCGTSLALMDAGVPLPRPVAGIAMGLIKEPEGFAVLSDILGDEDHLGDMDFKVAGTEKGVTALQMDIKISSITSEIMKVALEQARVGRLHILSEMEKCLSTPRPHLSPYAPRIVRVRIDKEKIRDLIGPGGRVIRDICERTKAKIDINEEGIVTIAGVDSNLVDQAIKIIMDIGAQPEIGTIHPGKVTRLLEFGALVQFMGSREGMVHISELAAGRTEKVSDVVQVGQEVQVKVLAVDERSGKIRLTLKIDA